MGPPEQPSLAPEGAQPPAPPSRLTRWFPMWLGWRFRLCIVGIVLVMVVPVHLMSWRQGAVGREKLEFIRSLEVGQIDHVTIYPSRQKTRAPLRVIDDPELLAPFAEAMNNLADYSANHPHYTVPWFLVVHLRDGTSFKLECRLMTWPDKTVYIRAIGGTGMPSFGVEVSSPSLYAWLVTHSWHFAEVDINAAVRHDWSLMHWAAQGGYEDIVELLLERGADINVLSRRMFNWQMADTPLDLVLDRHVNNKRMAAFLRERGAKQASELGR